MKARQMLLNGGFSPEDVVYMTGLLEEIWNDRKSSKAESGRDPSAERERLAMIILNLAPTAYKNDPEVFKAHVIHTFDGGL